MQFLSLLFLKAADIKLKLGHNKNVHSYFPYCHWNVNSLATDNDSKVLVLKSYNSTLKCDCICICETFLDFLFRLGNKSLMLKGYNSI